MQKHALHSLAAGVLISLLPALANALTVDLSANATLRAPNDQLKVEVFSEMNAATPQEVASLVNRQIAAALVQAKAYAPGVKTQTGSTRTNPVYGKNSRINSWQMRSDLQIESQDLVAFSELVGKLQNTLGVSEIQAMPSLATRKKFENDATLNAIEAFKSKADLIASSFNKPYRISKLSFNGQYQPRPVMAMRAKSSLMSEYAAMPMEAGESEITITVSGQIEIAD